MTTVLLLLPLGQPTGQWWKGLLLACAVLASGCASLPPAPGRGAPLRYTPHGGTEPGVAEPPHALASSRPSLPEPEEPQRLHRRRPARHTVTRAGPSRAAGEVGGTSEETRQAVLAAVDEVRGTRDALAATLARLASRPPGLGNRGLSGNNGIFLSHLDSASQQLPWIDGALGTVTALAEAASEIDDPDMQRALLRMSGPRLQAAMSGALLLAGWVDFLQLADGVLRQCPSCGLETLIVELRRVQGLVEPSLSALASGEMMKTASKSPRHSDAGLPTPRNRMSSASSEPGQHCVPLPRRPAGARSVLMTNCCARSCRTRKPDRFLCPGPRAWLALLLMHSRKRHPTEREAAGALGVPQFQGEDAAKFLASGLRLHHDAHGGKLLVRHRLEPDGQHAQRRVSRPGQLRIG